MNFQTADLSAGLYFVGVPIGTARDITLRALDVLASADVLVAEDTRSLRHLMDIHGVPLGGRRLQAFHDHSGTSIVDRLVEEIRGGKAVAYMSEAGMPLIADPGYELGAAVRQAGLPVTLAPGPSAAVAALVLGGLPTDAFFFAGFLPAATAARKRVLEDVREIPGTLIFYESPKRLAAMLADAAEVLGGHRRAVVCREITKKFEEVKADALSSLAEIYSAARPKGEIVVLIDRNRSGNVSLSEIEKDLEDAIETHSLRDAVDMVAQAHSMPRRQIYKMALERNKDQ